MTSNVIVLGGSGMLGSMVTDYLSRDNTLNVCATVRTKELAAAYHQKIKNVKWLLFDAAAPDLDKSLDIIRGYEWVINAIGITKPLVHDNNALEVERAIWINSVVPYHLVRKAETNKSRVLQIGTDCVYSGKKGKYSESDEYDPLDVYGKSKSLGEVASPNNYLLRCSIIGPEPKEHKMLLDWFLGQAKNSKVNGYNNHNWNGVTTLQFARLCQGIIKQDLKLTKFQHIIPTGAITKCQMLQEFAKNYSRDDIMITPVEASTVIDRTLQTSNETMNLKLWSSAGYSIPPTVPEMIAELARFDFRLKGN